MSRTLIILPAFAAALAGCDGGAGGIGQTGGGEVIRAMGACDVEGLSKPLRQTTVFLDARLLEKSADATEFAARNAGLRDIILSIADPTRIRTSGATAFREKVTIVVVPSDGSPAQPVFEGCPPGLSPEEAAEARAKSSGVGEFFTGDALRAVDKQGQEFTKQLIGGLSAAGTRAEGGPVRSTPVAQSPFLAGVRASRGLFEVQNQAQRLILVSDFSAMQVPEDATRRSGIAAGQQSAGNFNHSEVHLVTPPGKRPAHGEFMKGYFLAQGGNLASYAAGRIGTPLPPPRRLQTFTGQAAYPSGPETVWIRIGDDGSGKLAGSWVTLRGTPDRATPMSGRISCANPVQCEVRSDGGGFAQIWSGEPGPMPKFDSDSPFAGMRNFAFTIDEAKIGGRVYDDAVYIGDDQSNNAIRVTGTASSGN